MEYENEYIELLKKALAAETETVRLYLAIMSIAPNSSHWPTGISGTRANV